MISKSRKTGAALACLVWVSGCASQANVDALANLRMACARGDRNACLDVPIQEYVNQQEANRNARVVAAVALIPLAVFAGLAAGGGGGGGFHHHHYHGFHGGHHR